MTNNNRNSIPVLFYLLIIIAIGLLVIALFYLYDAILILQKGINQSAIYQLITGIVGIALSLYMFIQFRKRTIFIKKSLPSTIITQLECNKCGIKSLRKFLKGDYIYKTTDLCKKCSEMMLITGIYAEKSKKS